MKVNYRTSEEIRKYAQEFLRGVDIDDLDGGDAETLSDHSAFHGPAPEILKKMFNKLWRFKTKTHIIQKKL